MIDHRAAPDSPSTPLAPREIVDVLGGAPTRWWLSGGAALALWAGVPIRALGNIDISTTPADRDAVIGSFPKSYSAWTMFDGARIPWSDAPRDADLGAIDVHDDVAGAWVLRINVEDGTDRAWVYRRDARLQLPWERAVLDLDGIPTGAPEVQLVWKALRPRPEDDLDKAAVVPLLSDEARTWWERAILTIHPHSSWSIPLRSPMFPARASWNRPGA